MHFLRFCCKFSVKIIFYLPVNTDKPKFVAFLVFVCTTASFIAQISSTENVLKRDAILALVAKRWIAEDIPSYRSQSKRAKIAIHWFCKYYKTELPREHKFGYPPRLSQVRSSRVENKNLDLYFLPGQLLCIASGCIWVLPVLLL